MPFVAGNELVAYCSECKKDQKHTVIEANSGVVREVRCQECRTNHVFQRPHNPPKPKPAKKAAKPRKPRKPRKPKVTPWEELSEGRNLSDQKSYSIKETYVLHDVVTHKKFGIGIVSAVLEGGKIEIAFIDGEVRKLIHDRS